MNSLLLVNYFNKRANNDAKVQLLLKRTADCTERLEQLQQLNKELEDNNECVTIDEFELKRIAKLFRTQYNQELMARESIREAYTSVVKLCLQANRIDWDERLASELQLLQLQYQQEMRVAGERYEAQRQRSEQLEAREIVQQVRQKQAEIEKLKAEMALVRQTSTTERKQALIKYNNLKNKRNDSIVQFVQFHKRCKERAEKLKSVNNFDAQIATLEARKSELIQQYQKNDMELPGLTPIQKFPGSSLLPLAAPNFATFSKQNVHKVLEQVEKKLPTFQDFFAAWEVKRQAESQQNAVATLTTLYKSVDTRLSHTTTETVTPPTALNTIVTTVATTTVIPTTTFSTALIDINTSTTVAAPQQPRSILRKPTTPSPKKHVRFAIPSEGSSDDSNTEEEATNSESVTSTDSDEQHVTPTVATVNDEPLFGADMELEDEIIISSQTHTPPKTSTTIAEPPINALQFEQPINEEPPKKEREQRTLRKRKSSSTTTTLSNAKSRQKLPKVTPKFKGAKPLIEIQECRIIKPAGTALPKILPVEISPEVVATTSITTTSAPTTYIATTSITIASTGTTSTFTHATAKYKKSSESDTFFNDFLKSSLENGLITSSSQESITDAAETDVVNKSFLIPKSPVKAFKKPKSKPAKKFKADFESLFRQNIPAEGTEAVASTSTAAQRASVADDDNDYNDLLQFDMTSNDNLGSDDGFDDIGAVNGDAFFFSMDSADEQNNDEMTENFL